MNTEIVTQHTPGPWRLGKSTVGSQLLITHGDDDATSPIVGMVYSDGGRLPVDANARLIAAAPKMLAALKFALSEASGFACPASTEAVMRAAIDEAEAQS